MTETPVRLLELARQTLAPPAWRAAGPRAVALLGRQALEQFINDLWDWKEPRMRGSSTRAQLICLPRYLDPAIAARISLLWWALSRACHHHPYELAPTHSELAALLEETERVFADTARSA